MNATQASEIDISHCSSLVELLLYRATFSPDDTAYNFVSDNNETVQTLSYSELDRQARCIAAWIQTECSPGERALLLYPPGLDFISAFFGCLYSGVVAVPAYPPRDNRNAERLRVLAEDAKARLILSKSSQLVDINERVANELAGTVKVVASDQLVGGEALWTEKYPDANTLAFLQYTSGSTGKPKGVMVSHGNILHNERMMQAAFGHSRETVAVGWLPQFHDMGLIGNFLQPLFVGFPIILFSPVVFIKKPLIWLQLISRYRATTSGGPNFAYEHCINRISDQQKTGLDLSCWEVAFNGAEPIRPETLDRFAAAFAACGFRREAFYPCYGMAETTLLLTGGRKRALPKTVRINATNKDGESGEATFKHEKVSCGFPRLGQKILIVDPQTFIPCPDGEVGEIWTSGPSVAQGYWEKIEETKKIFRAQLHDSREGSFLRTGDLGFISEGELYVTGRRKDLIIIRGRNHYPQDIEETVEKSHPSLSPGGTASFSVEVGGEEQLVVLQEVKRNAQRSVITEEVCACIRRSVQQQHELNTHSILLLKTNRIPRTSSGKIQRYLCRSAYLTGELKPIGRWSLNGAPSVADCEAPKPHRTTDRAAIESWLVTNIANKTNVPLAQIDTREPLAAYGLDSMAVVTLCGELEVWMGRTLSPTLVYDYPTVESLSLYLSKLVRSEDNFVPTVSVPSSSEQAIEPIAIIGMGCRFPGAPTIEAFWKVLSEGIDTIVTVPNSRWDKTGFPLATRKGGFLDAVDQFDPSFFGISPREAECMDPQQRLLLEVTYEALENAFLPPNRLAGTLTGVFVGISSHDYSIRQRGEPTLLMGTGNAQSIAANRISYTYDFRGPSWSVDTACSSSLVAVHQACQSLRLGESDTAIVGGVNVMLSPDLSCIFSKAGMLAEDGRCKTFDVSADGYVRGEGCGVVVLRRLSDALAEGNSILALIRGTAVNQDGRTNGLTAPNGPSQEAVIRAALRNGRVQPDQVGYVEAHGTGTYLGDPIEFNALAAVLSSRDLTASPCLVGSVKTNIGHLEAAAGIAGLIKSVLMFRHEQIPPHVHLKELNPHFTANSFPLAVPVRLEPWQQGEHPRIAGVSSFGFGGTNSHVVIQEAPPVTKNAERDVAGRHLLVLSAKNKTALTELANGYDHFLSQHKGIVLDICKRASTGREHFEQRLALTGKTEEQLRQGIAAFLRGNSDVRFAAGRALGQAPKLAFLFTGQGSQYVQMGRSLYEGEPLFRATMERCANIADPLLPKPLIEVLYPSTDDVAEINETTWTQPVLFALEYSLAELWRSWGVVPDAVLGHSLGEYVAACVAGVFTLEDGMRLVIERGRLMQAITPEGAMIAVQAEEQVLAEIIRPVSHHLSIAAVNGPKECVLSGLRTTLMPLAAQLAAEGYRTKELHVSQGFHSPLMDTILEEFKKVANTISYNAPKIPLVSNVTGTVSDEVTFPEYWVRHIRETVRFYDGVVELDSLGCSIFLEIGPKPLTLLLAGSCLSSECELLPSLQKGIQDHECMLRTLAKLYTSGVQIDWSSFHGGKASKLCPVLPGYPFQRKRYWLEECSQKADLHVGSVGEREAVHPLLGRRFYTPLNSKEVIFEAAFGKGLPSYLCDYRVQGSLLFPVAAFIEMVLAAASFHFRTERVQVEDTTFISPIISPCEQERIVHTIIKPEGENKAFIEIYSCFDDDKAGELDWTLHVRGTIRPLGLERSFEEVTPVLEGTVVEDFYQGCRNQGLDFGQLFQGIGNLIRSGNSVQGDLVLKDPMATEIDNYRVHPTLLDAALQVVGAVLPDESDTGAWSPFSFGRLCCYQTPGNKLTSRARLKQNPGADSETMCFDLALVEGEGECILKIEDLSLRKMVLNPLANPTSNIEQYETDWHLSPLHDVFDSIRVSQRWVIFADRGGVAERLASRLRLRGDETCLVFAGDSFRKVDKGYHVNPTQPADFSKLFQQIWAAGGGGCMVYLWSLDLFSDDPLAVELDAAFRLGCQATLHMLQGLLAQHPSEVRLNLVTRNVQAVEKTAPVQPFQSLLWGMARVAATEHTELDCYCIDLESTDERAVDSLFREVTSSGNDKHIAYRNSMRYVGRLVPNTAEPTPGNVMIRRDSSYLITGGVGGLGLQVARWLVDQGAGTIILTGRTASSQVLSQDLKEAASGRTEIVVVSVDVTNYEDMGEVLERIQKARHPLKGVIHAAGVLGDRLLQQTHWQEFEKVLLPKVQGAVNLHLLTGGTDLDFFVCFSSVASILGPPAQGSYAAANAFLDAFCHYRKHLDLPAVSLNWGPWKDVGMVTSVPGSVSIGKRMEEYGIELISPGEGVERLGLLLGSPVAQMAIIPIRWSRFLENVSLEKDVYFQVIATLEGKAENDEIPSFAQMINGKTGAGLHHFLLHFFQDSIEKILGLDENELLPDQQLNTLGFDSLMLFELTNRVQKETGLKLALGEIMEGMTMEGLVTAVQGHLEENGIPCRARPDTNQRNTEQPQNSNSLVDDGDPTELLANLHHLSDDEVKGLLVTLQKG